jgi:hypothetical protein
MGVNFELRNIKGGSTVLDEQMKKDEVSMVCNVSKRDEECTRALVR